MDIWNLSLLMLYQNSEVPVIKLERAALGEQPWSAFTFTCSCLNMNCSNECCKSEHSYIHWSCFYVFCRYLLPQPASTVPRLILARFAFLANSTFLVLATHFSSCWTASLVVSWWPFKSSHWFFFILHSFAPLWTLPCIASVPTNDNAVFWGHI